MVEQREFATLDVLSVTTGMMLSRRCIDAVYEVCGFVLGDKGLTIFQLPAASEVASAVIFEQHPALAEVEITVDKSRPEWPAELQAICDAAVQFHGETLVLQPAKDPAWVAGNGLRDIVAMKGSDKVFPFRLGGVS